MDRQRHAVSGGYCHRGGRLWGLLSYCNVVVSERYWGAKIRAAGLDAKYDTVLLVLTVLYRRRRKRRLTSDVRRLQLCRSLGIRGDFGG